MHSTLIQHQAAQPARACHDGSRPRRPGFTLVELLVVVAIIAVLAALSLMLAPRIRRSAQTATSIGNLRQIHAMMMGYVTDKSGQFPLSVYQDEPDSPTWRRKIWENLNGAIDGAPLEVMANMQASAYASVMWCPMMVGQHGQDQHPEGRGSYSYNRFFMPPAWGGGLRTLNGAGVEGRREPYIMAGTLFGGDKRFGTFYHLDSAKFPYDTYWSNVNYAYGASGDQALGLFIDGHIDVIPKSKGIALDSLLRDPSKLE